LNNKKYNPMPTNPAIEEKIVELAKIAHRFIACGQPDCEGCTYENNELVSEIRTAFADIYQLGVSDGVAKTVIKSWDAQAESLHSN
jgi:hypothetical protein